MATGRRIEEELEARRCLLAVAASGRPLAACAREHGIDGRSLNAWRVNLGRREARSGLVELVPSSRATMASRGAGYYVLVVDGVRMEFGGVQSPQRLCPGVRS